jgi:hypothetical protein
MVATHTNPCQWVSYGNAAEIGRAGSLADTGGHVGRLQPPATGADTSVSIEDSEIRHDPNGEHPERRNGTA